MLVAPIMAMLIFGYAFGSGTKHVPVTIVDQDGGAVAASFIGRLDHDVLTIATSSDPAAASQAVHDGQSVAAIVIPAGFSADVSPTRRLNPSAAVASPRGTRLTITLDSTNQPQAAAVRGQIAGALAGALAAQSGQTSPVSLNYDYAFAKAKDASYTDSLVPGIIAFAITVFTTLITLLAFVGERTSGTLDRLRVSPATESEIVIGYELAFGLIAAIQGALLLAVAVLVYHVLVVGPVVAAATVVILTAIDAQAIGIVVSAAAKRESQAVQFLPFIIFPTFLLSGIFVPLSSLPNWLRPFSYLIPPTWAIEATRNVLLRGWGFDRIWLHLVILTGFAVLFTLGAIIGLKRSRA
jgi:ABC-2 type transport system permease protein